MCGIAGIIDYKQGKRADHKKLKQMLTTLKHRGPDGSASFLDGPVAIGMTRLAIVDLAGGMQPLYNEDKSIKIVGNGEIYNYKELQKKLLFTHHKLRTGSDIETIAHLYEDYGTEFVKKLRGMFALAIFDKKNKKVILARDRMGEKPIYYSDCDGCLIFSSEMKSIIKYGGISKELNKKAINDYFHYNYIPEPDTAFINIKKLPAGNLLIIDLIKGSFYKECYWNADNIKADDLTDPTEKIKKTLHESSKISLRADVKVGISLSGGLDSGAILALSAPKYKDQMLAFTVGYEGYPKTDERLIAEKIASEFNVKHIKHEIKTKDVVNYFPNLIRDSDDPIADVAGYSIFSVSKIAKEYGIKVLLNGIGGDELFWGYSWVRKVTTDNYKNRSTGKYHFYDRLKSYTPAEKIVNRLYNRSFKNKIDKHTATLDIIPKSKIAIARNSQNIIRSKWLVSNCIDLNDRLSMANSVELRSPLLDYKLVDIAYSSRKNVLSFNSGSKYWFKKALSGIFTNKHLNMPKKGFTPPVARWYFALIKRYGFLLKDGFLVNEKILSKKKLKIAYYLMLLNPFLWDTLYQFMVLEIWGREYVWGQTPKQIKNAKK